MSYNFASSQNVRMFQDGSEDMSVSSDNEDLSGSDDVEDVSMDIAVEPVGSDGLDSYDPGN
jgi:hypothetical protein